MRKRVLLMGLFHETHTFLEGITRLSDFRILRGSSIFSARGDGSPLDGALHISDKYNWDLIPVVDVRALPGSTVDDAVLEFAWNEFKCAAESAYTSAPIDGIFLILHGAMVSSSFVDVEGELLERIRNMHCCAGVPLCGVLDLHANFSERMADFADVLLAYRENPHTDAKAVAISVAATLQRLMHTSERPKTVWAHSRIIWTPQGTGTAVEPMKALERIARNLEIPQEVICCNIFGGFAYSDNPDTGVSFSLVTFGDRIAAQKSLDALVSQAHKMKHEGLPSSFSPQECILAIGNKGGPIVIAEPSDNIGAGAPGDGTGLLRMLVSHNIHNALICLCDPVAVKYAINVGAGRSILMKLGGHSIFDAGPLELSVTILSINDGLFKLEDENSHLATIYGTKFDMGPCAVVKHNEIYILLTSVATPPLDLAQYHSQGLYPESFFIVGVKAAAAHRQAYDPISLGHLFIDTPGACPSNLRSLPFTKVRRPVFPLDECAFSD